MRSNCLIFAFWRSIRRGGALILVGSRAGPYLHAMWAAELPHNLRVEHFIPDDKSEGLHLEPLFLGGVAYLVGKAHAVPPKEKWGFSPVFLFNWFIYFLGWAAFLALLAFPIYSYAEDARVCDIQQERGVIDG